MNSLFMALLVLMVLLLTVSDATTIPIRHSPDPSSSWEDMVTTYISRDTSRLAYLSSLAQATTPHRSFAPIAAGRQLLQIPNYIIKANLGSSNQTLMAALDTSNDAAWFPCTGCVGCTTSSASFSSVLSTSFRPIPCGSLECTQVPNPSCPTGANSCSFNLTYGGSSIQASLVQDSLSLTNNDVVPSYIFGCLQAVTGNSVPPQGLLGLGRGPLSFLSQTKTLYSSTFSYCLPNFKTTNFSGTLRLGTAGQPIRIKTTPLLTNPRRSSLYYVNLLGIRVGRKVVAIPPESLAFDTTSGAGTIIDSGTMFTRLVAPAYVAVRDEFRLQVQGAVGPVTTLGGFDTCYNGAITAPTMTLMFSGLNVTLPPDNLLIHSSSGSLSCLAMASAPDNVNSVLNVIANMQQQNMRVLFDVPNARIGFAREACTVLA